MGKKDKNVYVICHWCDKKIKEEKSNPLIVGIRKGEDACQETIYHFCNPCSKKAQEEILKIMEEEKNEIEL